LSPARGRGTICAARLGVKAKNFSDVLVYAYESQTHPVTARDEEYITEDELVTTRGKYIEITKMLTPWINYLQRCNWRQRGQRPDQGERR
jgi:predicted ThiF/HesA family dinucleotide-utilizing enzyme